MRKITLLLVILLVCSYLMGASQSFDLELVNTNIPTNVEMGKKIPVTGDIRNNGPDDYLTLDGKITMNVHARYSPLSPSDSFDVQPITSFDIAVNRLDAGQSISYTGEFDADPTNFRVGHSGVTVIVWPKISGTGSGGVGVGDTIIRNHYYFTQVDVTTTTGVDDLNDVVNLQLYPNPAAEYVKVNLLNSSAGKLSLTDPQGKELAYQEVTPQSLEYQIGLTELDLVPGYYVVTFEGGEGSWSQKLIVTNK